MRRFRVLTGFSLGEMTTEFRSEILSDGSGRLALVKSAAESDGGKNTHDVVLNSTTLHCVT